MADTKRVKQLVRQIESWQGWQVKETKAGWMAYPPDKAKSPVQIHRTPSDHRWYQNTVSHLRQAGAPL